jgi:hypothetical protein
MAKRIFLLLVVSFLLIILIAGCQRAKEIGEKKEAEKAEVAKEKVEKPGQPTKTNPIVVDKEAGEVRIYTEVNGKYFFETTRHGIVFKDGKNGDKSVLRAYVNQNKFHDALLEIGAKPGNKLTLESKPGTKVAGDVLTVKVSWDDKSYDFKDIIKQEPDKGFEVRFGGNEERAKEKFTGCILCLDSCPVGITSNSTWGFGDWKAGQVKFYGREDVLPPDGSPVIVTFSLP